jgi:hypothetical protein
MNYSTLSFYLVSVSDIILSVLILADNIRQGGQVGEAAHIACISIWSQLPKCLFMMYIRVYTDFFFAACCGSARYTHDEHDFQGPGDLNMAKQSVELPVACLTIGILVKLVGLWGVHKERIRYLSIFVAVSLFLVIREYHFFLDVYVGAVFLSSSLHA